MHLIIDADPIVYRSGFAAETTEYHLVVESPAGSISEMHFAPKPKSHAGDQMRKWLKAHPSWVVLSKDRDVHPESEEFAIEATRTQVQSIEKACRENYGVDAFDEITIVLSGPGNYRERLATIFPYKGNRDPEHKPYWYQAIRNHLTHDWGAVVVHGREADDECSIIAANHRLDSRVRSDRLDYVVATIDKDLDQIPGEHYNYLKQVFYRQPADAARAFFWQQALSGDPTDGIPGCWRVGETKAIDFMARVSGSSESSIWNGIVACYAASQEIAGCPYVDRDPAAVALENARLVYLQQEEGELWNPPGTPMGTLEEYLDDE
jgi:hypothetical protein